MSADEIIDKLAIEEALSQLPEDERAIMEMVYHYRRPDDYEGVWPPNHTQVGVYVGLKYHGKALSESTIRNRRNSIIERWKFGGKSQPARRKYTKNAKKSD